MIAEIILFIQLANDYTFVAKAVTDSFFNYVPRIIELVVQILCLLVTLLQTGPEAHTGI
jgi:hypothetical protein